MSGYIVQQWEVSPTPHPTTHQYVNISARAPGLMSAIMSVIGMSAISKLALYDDTLVLEEGSLSGQATQMIPLDKITSVTYGFAKPYKEAMIMGITLGLFTFGIGAIVGIIYYFLLKTVNITVTASGGVVSTLSLKNGGSGGVTPEQVGEVAQMIYHKRK